MRFSRGKIFRKKWFVCLIHRLRVWWMQSIVYALKKKRLHMWACEHVLVLEVWEVYVDYIRACFPRKRNNLGRSLQKSHKRGNKVDSGVIDKGFHFPLGHQQRRVTIEDKCVCSKSVRYTHFPNLWWLCAVQQIIIKCPISLKKLKKAKSGPVELERPYIWWRGRVTSVA